MKKPKILFFDIETTPNIVTTFSIKDKNPIHYQNIRQERSIICISYKLADSNCVKTVRVGSKYPQNDGKLLKKFSRVVSGVDAIVAHYGDGFDVPFINARLVYHKLQPMAPAAQIDTYKMARRKFLFNSNKLDYLGQFLGLGKKKHISYDTWLGCLEGKSAALAEMVSYNKQDVILLEKVYNRLNAFCKPKLNSAALGGLCAHCGSWQLTKRGFTLLKNNKRQRYQCKECGGWE